MRCGGLCERSVEVSLHISVLGCPDKLLSVCEHTCGEGRAVVATKTNKHYSELRDAGVGTDRLFLNDGSGNTLGFVKEGKTGLVIDLNVVLRFADRNSGKAGCFLVLSKCVLALGSGVNDWCLFHLVD